MLNSIINLASSVLPSVSKEKINEAKEAILQFENDGDNYSILSSPLTEMSQGDIIEKINFYSINGKTGNLDVWTSPGMVLSTSCNIDNNPSVLIAPLVRVEDYKTNENTLKDIRKNVVFDFMYLKTIEGNEYFADFNKTLSFPIELLKNEKSEVIVKKSLTQLGYYLFIIKLTIFLMRKEDDATMNSRLRGT